MSEALEKTFLSLDELIRAGKLAEAQHHLSAFRRARIPRRHLGKLAWLALRAGMPDLTLRILHPHVRPEDPRSFQASEEECAYYAAGLVRIGVPEEALKILKNLDATKLPDVLLYEVAALVANWDYASTLRLLDQYISAPGITDYQKLVGEVNLGAALVHTRSHERAQALLADVHDRCRKNNFTLLFSTSLYLLAENALLQHDWKATETLLAQAEKEFGPASGLNAFYIVKWRAMLALMREPRASKSVEGLAKLRERAKELSHWETLRDCDLFEGVFREDKALLEHLYFGTPFESFRSRITQEFGVRWSPPDHYVWYPSGPGESGKAIDMGTGEVTGSRASKTIPVTLQRCLAALSSDFYRPFRVPGLFAKLYPGEYYNPSTSPFRVHQVKRRLREWLTSNAIHLEVSEKEGNYRLSSRARFGLTLRLTPPSEAGWKIGKLQEALGGKTFSIGQVTSLLGLNRRTALRLLTRAEQAGEVSRKGKRAATRYTFKTKRDAA